MSEAFVPAFLRVVAANPRATAVLDRGVPCTYDALAERAGRLAARLRARGVGPEVIVGLCLEKSTEYIAAVLAVWWAGGAFLPLAPALPRARLARMTQGASAALVLAAGDTRSLAEHLGAPVLDAADLPGAPMEPHPYKPDDLAYLIYTSGSTGAPKGVLVTHRGVTPLLRAQIHAFRLDTSSRSLLYLSLAFDASLSDIGTALLSGAALCIESDEALAGGAGLFSVLRAREITHADLPPSLLRVLDPNIAPACLQTVIAGGEPCPPSVYQRWAARVRLVNVYGPTEATICASLCVVDPVRWDRPLLGRPTPGAGFHLLDAHREPARAGAEAELYLSGPGLARGYLHAPSLTNERFIWHESERLYRTGDLVREHPDGAVEFLGRVDRQLKLRGKLLAPEEVEAALESHPDVSRAAVLLRPIAEGGRAVLVAFVTPREGAVIPADGALHDHAARTLPAWMLPARYVTALTLPETASGKVDFTALSLRPIAGDTARGRAPSGATEVQLAALFGAVLGVTEVRADQGFHALGGDSVAALELVAAAEARGLAVSAALLERYPTVAALAAQLDARGAADTEAISTVFLRADVAAGRALRAPLRAARRRVGALSPRAAPRAVLLTGATGFLGAYLLRELLARTSARIYCLARAPDDGAARVRCAEALGAALPSRVTALAGELTRARFGLDARSWRALARQIDSVYHCAAEVNIVRSYASLRPANVGGTETVLRFLCAGRRKRLHDVSTLSVLAATDRARGTLLESDALEHAQTVYGGYAQSKWAAEILLRNASDAAGSVAHYRLGLLTGDARTGRGPRGEKDQLAMFLRGIAAIGAVPEYTGEALALDVTPVDYAAAALAHLSLAAAPEEGTATFHLANTRPATLEALVTALRAEGVSVASLPERAWRARATATPGADAAAAHLALCRCFSSEKSYARHRALDLFLATGVRFDTERARAGLAGSGIVCPPPDAALLRAYVRHALGRV